MTVLQRIKKVVNWLIFIGYAESEKEVAEKLGYTKSSFSQIVNGRVPLSDKFIKKLCSTNSNINEVWILTGEGEILHEDKLVNIGPEITMSREVFELIQNLTATNLSQQKTIHSLQEKIGSGNVTYPQIAPKPTICSDVHAEYNADKGGDVG